MACTWRDVRLTDATEKKRDPGGGMTAMYRSISAEGRSVTEKLQALMGTPQPAELSVRPAQLPSGLARS